MLEFFLIACVFFIAGYWAAKQNVFAKDANENTDSKASTF